MANNMTNNWQAFIFQIILWFIIIIAWGVAGADIIVFAKIFTQEYMANDCPNSNLTYIEALFPTNQDNPPYGGTYSCPKQAPRRISAQTMTCAYTDSTDSSSQKSSLIWKILESMGMAEMSWPYNMLYTQGETSSVGHWYKYTLANLVFQSAYFNRRFLRVIFEFFSKVPFDTILLILGPFFFFLLPILSTFWGMLAGWVMGIFGPMFESGPGDVPTGVARIYTLIALLIGAGVWVAYGFIAKSTHWWLDNWILKTIFLGFLGIIFVLIGGFIYAAPIITNIGLLFYSLFAMFYPFFVQKGKFILDVLSCNKDVISWIYLFFVCIWAEKNLINSLSSSIWMVFIVITIMKIFSFFRR